MKNLQITEMLAKAIKTHDLSHEEIVFLLTNANNELFSVANQQRKKFVGNEIHLRGLIEFSNICKCSCKYCGIRSANKQIERYRLNAENIINLAKQGIKQGYKTIVLQSGEDTFFDKNLMVNIIKEIKKFDVALTLSIGERSFEDYKAFREAGADRYLLRIETTDKKLYTELHPNMSFENRKRCLEDLKTLNYEVGSGCLVGLPNQTIQSLADDILFFKKMNFDMIGIGPFIPHPQTPLKNYRVWTDNFLMSLKVMAITRLLLPDINIPATTAMETLSKNGRIIALQSGANVFMPNITDNISKEKYEIYPNKTNTEVDDFLSEITSIGRTISKNYGFRQNIL